MMILSPNLSDTPPEPMVWEDFDEVFNTVDSWPDDEPRGFEKMGGHKNRGYKGNTTRGRKKNKMKRWKREERNKN